MAQVLKPDVHRSLTNTSTDDSAENPLDPCNVFVKYLPADLLDSDLTTLFGTFGEVISSKIMLDPSTRKSLGFGFVRFNSPDEARNAISGMDGHRIGTKKLLCKLANSPKEKQTIPVSAGKATSDDSPRHGGNNDGSLANRSNNSVPIQPSSSSTSSSLSVIDSSLRTPSSASSTAPSTLIVNMSPSHVPPQPVSRSSSTPNLPSSPSTSSPSRTHHHQTSLPTYKKVLSTNLYIKALLPTDTEETLQLLFSPYGEIEACKVMVDRATGLSRRIGFVRYKTQEQATKAMDSMRGCKRGDSFLRVKYADDEKQRDMRKRLRQAATTPSASIAGSTALANTTYGMLARHGSLDSQVSVMRGAASMPAGGAAGGPPPSFMPLGWPYAWTGAPAYPQTVYDASNTPWLLMYTPHEGYTSPRGHAQAAAYAYAAAPPHPMYFAYEPSSDQFPDMPRTYARTAPIPVTFKPSSHTNTEDSLSDGVQSSSAPSS